MTLPAKLLLLLSCLGLTAGASVACHATVDDGSDVSTGRLTTAVKPGADFVRCWSTNDGNADDFFRVYTISCHASSAGLGSLVGSRIDVDATVANGNVSSAILDQSMDKDVVVGRASKSDFPLSLRVYGTWAPDDAFLTVSPFRTTVSLAEAATTDAPLIVKMPFGSWPLRFLNHTSQAVIQSAPYTVDAAPFITSQDENNTGTTFQNTLYTPQTSGLLYFLDPPAPKSGSITLSVDGAFPEIHTQIAAPGTYVIETDGVHLASAAEEAEADAASASADAGADASPPTTAADSGAPPVVDSGAPAVPTTCGNNAQSPCTAGGVTSCNAGTRFDPNSGTCIACGAAGQTYCDSDPSNASGNAKCDDGTRFDPNSGTCIACGAAGQTYCDSDPSNASGNAKCDDGTRFDPNSGTCIACGAAGQTYCDSDPSNASGNPKCNPGLTYSSFNGTCN